MEEVIKSNAEQHENEYNRMVGIFNKKSVDELKTICGNIFESYFEANKTFGDNISKYDYHKILYSADGRNFENFVCTFIDRCNTESKVYKIILNPMYFEIYVSDNGSFNIKNLMCRLNYKCIKNIY